MLGTTAPPETVYVKGLPLTWRKVSPSKPTIRSHIRSNSDIICSRFARRFPSIQLRRQGPRSGSTTRQDLCTEAGRAQPTARRPGGRKLAQLSRYSPAALETLARPTRLERHRARTAGCYEFLHGFKPPPCGRRSAAAWLAPACGLSGPVRRALPPRRSLSSADARELLNITRPLAVAQLGPPIDGAGPRRAWSA